MPSLKLTVEHADHARDGEDPHWWHSIANVRRATKIVCDAFSAASPGDRADLEELAHFEKHAGFDNRATQCMNQSPPPASTLPNETSVFGNP